MPDHPPIPAGSILRHFTVAVFVVHNGQVLLHFHRKLQRWLPPGGHIEDGELPDEAAAREVREETGIQVRLMGPHGLPQLPGEPTQLVVPAGVQVEDIYPGHQHVDLVYFAVPASVDPADIAIAEALVQSDQVGWYDPGTLAVLGASEEIQAWVQRAVAEVSA
jgi:8-oxo-dGTP pyrophosphatase MutT (NUDIX family)